MNEKILEISFVAWSMWNPHFPGTYLRHVKSNEKTPSLCPQKGGIGGDKNIKVHLRVVDTVETLGPGAQLYSSMGVFLSRETTVVENGVE